MAEKHVHKVYGSFPPWGKSVEFPAGGGGGNKYTYYDISGLSEEDKAKAMDYAYVAKENADGTVYYDCMGLKYRNDYIAGIVAIGVDLSVRVGGPDGLFTIAEVSEGFF